MHESTCSIALADCFCKSAFFCISACASLFTSDALRRLGVPLFGGVALLRDAASCVAFAGWLVAAAAEAPWLVAAGLVEGP